MLVSLLLLSVMRIQIILRLSVISMEDRITGRQVQQCSNI